MCEYSFEINIKPKPQKRVRITKWGNFDPSKDYKKLIKGQLLNTWKEKPLECPILAEITFCMPVPSATSKRKKKDMLDGYIKHVKRPDIDNLEKAILDSLNGTVVKDDSQIFDLHSKKEYSDNPRTLIKITTLETLSD